MRYNLYFTNGKTVSSVCDPIDLPGDDEARQEALLVAHDLWDDPSDYRTWKDWVIHMTDTGGRPVVSLSPDSSDGIKRLKTLTNGPNQAA